MRGKEEGRQRQDKTVACLNGMSLAVWDRRKDLWYIIYRAQGELGAGHLSLGDNPYELGMDKRHPWYHQH
jgi:hypothetical protein